MSSGSKYTTQSLTNILTQELIESYDKQVFDICTIFYNEFQSVLVQNLTQKQLIPTQFLSQTEAPTPQRHDKLVAQQPTALLPYLFEPNEEHILRTLVPTTLNLHIYGCLLESIASEQGARLTAMDNATRNAKDMIDALTLSYNRTRQAYITKELIEIISGAESL